MLSCIGVLNKTDMSFKRDGDDSNWLKLLRKKRINELFAENIPEAEALLTNNGRFACLVCPNKPVFDTVHVLAVHRNGKKHLAAQNYFGNKPQSRNKIPVQSFLSKLTYNQGISSGNGIKMKPECKDFGTLRENLKITKELECLTSVKPYESKCNISSSYTLHRVDLIKQDFEINFHTIPVKDGLPPETHKENKTGSKILQKYTHKSEKSIGDNLHKWTTEQKELFINKLESGWKRTGDREWIRDEGVEFDSDEETPVFN